MKSRIDIKHPHAASTLQIAALLGAATLTGGCLPQGLNLPKPATSAAPPATTTAAPATTTATPAPAATTSSMTDKSGDGGKGQNSSYGY